MHLRANYQEMDEIKHLIVLIYPMLWEQDSIYFKVFGEYSCHKFALRSWNIRSSILKRKSYIAVINGMYHK